MIKWSDIDAEVDEFQSGYRDGFVAIFKKYEGMETDERDGSNRVVKITTASFSRRYGINENTFRDWVNIEVTTARRAERGGLSQRMNQIAEDATAKAEALAATALVAALERQARENEAKAKRDAEAAEKATQAALKKAERDKELAVQAERRLAAAEEKAKAEKKLEHIEQLLRAQIAAEPPTPQVLAEMAKQALTSSDPDIVNKMAEAYGQHRVEQDKRNKADASARAAANRAAAAERDALNAEKRASQEYEDSALKLYVDAHVMLEEAATLLRRKSITFSNVIASGLTVGEIQDMVDEDVETCKRVEASCLDVAVDNVQVQ